MKLLLIGAGKFGQNYIKTISSNFPNIKLEIANKNNWKQLIENKPDGVIIATQPNYHIDIALFALQQNIPILVEKPLALSLSECNKIKNFQIPILVNHIHLFSEAHQKIKKIIDPKDIWRIDTFISGSNFNHNYSPLFDFGCHEIAIILDLLKEYPQNIQYEMINNYQSNIYMQFNNCYSDSLISVSDPLFNIKERKLEISFNGLELSYDDQKRPKNHIPPLTNVIKVFIDAIGGKEDPRLGLDLSLKIVKILEECQHQLNISA